MINYYNEKDTLDPDIYDEYNLSNVDFEDFDYDCFLEPNTSEECVSQEELDGLWNNLELVSNDRKLTPDPPHSGFYYLHSTKAYAITR